MKDAKSGRFCQNNFKKVPEDWPQWKKDMAKKLRKEARDKREELRKEAERKKAEEDKKKD